MCTLETKCVPWKPNVHPGNQMCTLETKYALWKPNMHTGNQMCTMETKCARWKPNAQPRTKYATENQMYTIKAKFLNCLFLGFWVPEKPGWYSFLFKWFWEHWFRAYFWNTRFFLHIHNPLNNPDLLSVRHLSCGC